MDRQFTAVIQHDESWWVGWIEEIPGVNAQERSKEELLVSLKEALDDILELNREEARKDLKGEFEEVAIPA